jgi:hypothetical protein
MPTTTEREIRWIFGVLKEVEGITGIAGDESG